MNAIILDGKPTAADLRSDLKVRVAALRDRGIVPGPGTVLVGDDPGSRSYVPASTGLRRGRPRQHRRELPETPPQAHVEAVVAELNDDPTCTGYIVQLPLPKGLDANPLLGADGRRPRTPTACTRSTSAASCSMESARCRAPRAGAWSCCAATTCRSRGAEVVIVGRGVTVGRPLGLLLTRRSENATVTLCHTGTKDLAAHLRRADVIVAAAGSPAWSGRRRDKPGAAVLDVGITRTEAGLVGDVDPAVARGRGFLAPEPGGVGPMTRAMLLTNVVEAAERAAS